LAAVQLKQVCLHAAAMRHCHKELNITSL